MTYNTTTTTNNNNKQTHTLSSLTGFPTHIRSSSFTVSVHTPQSLTNLLIFLSLSLSNSILLMASWCLS